jgi:hypothetical protein
MRRDGEAERPDAAAQNSAGCLDQVARLMGKLKSTRNPIKVMKPNALAPDSKAVGFRLF